MSNPSFNIEVRGDLLRRIPEISDGRQLVGRLAGALQEQNALTVSHIQQTYLSFPRQDPTTKDGLRYITGSYQRSLRAQEPEIGADGSLTSGIGTNIKTKDGVSYPAVHEFGAEIPAHDIRARNGKALRFIGKGGKVIFCKVIKNWPGAKIPARKPIQRGIQDRLNDYNAAFNKAIEKMLQETI